MSLTENRKIQRVNCYKGVALQALGNATVATSVDRERHKVDFELTDSGSVHVTAKGGMITIGHALIETIEWTKESKSKSA